MGNRQGDLPCEATRSQWRVRHDWVSERAHTHTPQIWNNAVSLINDCSEQSIKPENSFLLFGIAGPYMNYTKCDIIQKVRLKKGRLCPLTCPSHLKIEIWDPVCNIWVLFFSERLAKGSFNQLHVGQTMHSTHPTAHRVNKSTKLRRRWGTLRSWHLKGETQSENCVRYPEYF